MSSTRDITIEDRHGATLHVEIDDAGTIMAEVIPSSTSATDGVELDETDRRDLADFLSTR